MIIENAPFDVTPVLTSIPKCDRRAIEILITRGNITVDYELLKTISKHNIIENITRFNLEYGEELFIIFLDSYPVKEYYMKSTFIPDKFKNLWLAVASIDFITEHKFITIGKNKVKMSTIRRGDRCQILKKEVLKYVKNNPVNGYFIQMLANKMPITFNTIKDSVNL